VSDGQDLSTPELVRALAAALDRRPRLFPCPPGLLRAVASLTGQGAAVDRLLGSLQVSGERVAARLGWRPPVPQAEGLRRTALWYRATVHGAAGAGSGAA
jgi:nucleoside-diphosphate-sugar epimerase